MTRLPKLTTKKKKKKKRKEKEKEVHGLLYKLILRTRDEEQNSKDPET